MNDQSHTLVLDDSYWKSAWRQFQRRRLGLVSLFIIALFCIVGIYAPFLASSKPLVVYYDGSWYFPLFRYLFYRGFFTKRLDLFYNLLIFTLPLFIFVWIMTKEHFSRRLMGFGFLIVAQATVFGYLAYRTPQDPAADQTLTDARQERLQQRNGAFVKPQSWAAELEELSPYAKLNMILRFQQRKSQQKQLMVYQQAYAALSKRKGVADVTLPTLWQMDRNNEEAAKERLNEILVTASGQARDNAQAQLNYLNERYKWLDEQASQLRYEVMPLFSHFHWEDDAGGDQTLNRLVHWWELTRINRKDLLAALIFGVRISLSVGLIAVSLALLIGIPIGAIAGYYGGKVDLFLYRLIEIWESMPTFFMLLLVVAILQSKSIFLVIGVIGLFGWTGFSRYIRGEFFKQKQLPYVEACHALGFNNRTIIFSNLLPNAIPPLLTLIPFSIMAAITSEAGLSFLGLGEEGSCSWGILMDEGRSVFPAESYLLWPPAILLTVLLVSIALVGDALRDSLDPKMHRA